MPQLSGEWLLNGLFIFCEAATAAPKTTCHATRRLCTKITRRSAVPIVLIAVIGLANIVAAQEKVDPEQAEKRFLKRDQPEEEVVIPDLSKYDADQLRVLATQLYKKIHVLNAKIKDIKGGELDRKIADLKQRNSEFTRHYAELREVTESAVVKSKKANVRAARADVENQRLRLENARLKLDAQSNSDISENTHKELGRLRKQIAQRAAADLAGTAADQPERPEPAISSNATEADEAHPKTKTDRDRSSIWKHGPLVPVDEDGRGTSNTWTNWMWSRALVMGMRPGKFDRWKQRYDLAQANIDRGHIVIEEGLTLIASVKPHLWHALNHEGKLDLLDSARTWYIEQSYLEAYPQRVMITLMNDIEERISMDMVAASSDWGATNAEIFD